MWRSADLALKSAGYGRLLALPLFSRGIPWSAKGHGFSRAVDVRHNCSSPALAAVGFHVKAFTPYSIAPARLALETGPEHLSS
jgi:hypothetical protein